MPAFVIRHAAPEDTEKILVYMRRLLSEPDHNLRMEPDEFTYTLEQEGEIIRKYTESPNSLFLVAETEDQIIGVLTCEGTRYRAEAHVTCLGISVDQAWRGKGLGSVLMEKALHWAQHEVKLRRVFLYVLARNTGAIKLYERLGFEIEGRLRDDLYRNGQYLDTFVMSVLFKENDSPHKT